MTLNREKRDHDGVCLCRRVGGGRRAITTGGAARADVGSKECADSMDLVEELEGEEDRGSY